MTIETSSNGWHRFLVFSFVILRTMPSGRADSSESFGRCGPSRWREAGGHPCAPGDCGPKKKTNIDRCWWPTCRKQADAKAAEIHSIQWLLRGSWRQLCFLLLHLSSTASCTSSGNVLYIDIYCNHCNHCSFLSLFRRLSILLYERKASRLRVWRCLLDNLRLNPFNTFSDSARGARSALIGKGSSFSWAF